MIPFPTRASPRNALIHAAQIVLRESMFHPALIARAGRERETNPQDDPITTFGWPSARGEPSKAGCTPYFGFFFPSKPVMPLMRLPGFCPWPVGFNWLPNIPLILGMIFGSDAVPVTVNGIVPPLFPKPAI
jgi:hypothetical protein